MTTSRHLRDQCKKYGVVTEAAETIDDLNIISYKIHPCEEEKPVEGSRGAIPPPFGYETDKTCSVCGMKHGRAHLKAHEF